PKSGFEKSGVHEKPIEGEATCLITFIGPKGIANRPYNLVFALIDTLPVVLALNPISSMFWKLFIESFQVFWN
mgnify:CR=1